MTSNRDIVSDAFHSWMNGTGYVASIFADDMTWEITGRSAASKRKRAGLARPGPGSRQGSPRPRLNNRHHYSGLRAERPAARWAGGRQIGFRPKRH
jgi:hypothetical protein